MTPSRRSTFGLLAVALVALAADGCSLASSSHRSSSRAHARVGSAKADTLTVGHAIVGHPVRPGFVGLSTEYKGFAAYAGQNPAAPDPVFEQLIRDIAPSQRPVLRIGGDSTDWAWVPTRGVSRSGGVRYFITEPQLKTAAAVAQALGARMILGVNLEADSRRLASAEAHAMVAAIGRSSLLALELGNEPELYASFNWYRTPAGVGVRGRPPGYDFPAFVRDFSNLAGSLPRGVPLAGPSTGAPLWMQGLGSFLSAEPRVAVATLHRYPLKHCVGYVHQTLGQLLADSSARGLADSVAPYVAVAHAHRTALRIDELNAVACGGEYGISDTFGAALWALDALFEMARVGVDGVNFHTEPGLQAEMFRITSTHGGWQAVVHPEYYGLVMFAQAAPPGSRLLRVSGATGAGLHVWATRAPDGRVRIVLINESTAHSRTVRLRAGSTSGAPATLERLQAPSAHAKNGVMLGGQSFGASTSTGQLAGAPVATTVSPGSAGYVVTVPAASAALLTLAAS